MLGPHRTSAASGAFINDLHATGGHRTRRQGRPGRQASHLSGGGRRLAPLTAAGVAAQAGPTVSQTSTALTTVPASSNGVAPYAGPSPSPALREHQLATAPGPSPLLLTVTESDTQQVSVWPTKPQHTRQKQRVAKNAKAPLALQLEAFIRKEHRQYLLENPDCSRADTLHIFREAFTVLVDHFTEYKSILSLIRDEYDAALDEMSEQTRRMRMTHLENKSDRSLHAMELIQLKESLNATISNQQAQLKASQGFLHALREQLATAEHANSLLRYEMERRLREHDDAKDQVKLLARALTEESARTALVMEDSRKKDREMKLMNARLKVMKENVEELEACVRAQTQRRWRGDSSRDESPSVERESESAGASSSSQQARRPDVTAEPRADRPTPGKSSYTDEYVHGLLSTIDSLEFALALAKNGPLPRESAGEAAEGTALTEEERAGGASATASAADGPHRPEKTLARRTVGRLVEQELPVLREWLRQEGIVEGDVEDTDYLLPPGHWPTEPLAFLKACLPVINRHLTLADTLRLLEEFWFSREQAMDYSRLPEFFLNWLAARTGGGSGMKELGVNLLQACQRNVHHPECRAILLLLRGFLPEQLVLTWRKDVKSLRDYFETTAAAAGTQNAAAMEDFFQQVRATWPGKPRSHILQLRAYIFRLCRGGTSEAVVDCDRVLAPESYFVTLLKRQMLREVEEFTLRVVEGVRAQGDSAKNVVHVAKVVEVVRSLDCGMRDETLYGLVADAAQKTLLEVASADAGAPLQVRLDTLLTRLRGSILLRRASAEE